MDPKIVERGLQNIVSKAVELFTPKQNPLEMIKSWMPQEAPVGPREDAQTALSRQGWVKNNEGVWVEPKAQINVGQVQMQQAPQLMPTPTMSPQQMGPSSQADGFVFDYNQLPRDKFYAENGKRANFQPQQPPREFGQLIREIFPNEATAAAAVASSENATFDPNRPDNINWNGTPDRGQWQINQDTFNGLMERRGAEMAQIGVNSFEQTRDPRKATQIAKMIKEEGSWNRWYGPQDTGFNLNEGYFSPGTERAYYAENMKNGMSNQQALDKARERLAQEAAERKRKAKK